MKICILLIPVVIAVVTFMPMIAMPMISMPPSAVVLVASSPGVPIMFETFVVKASSIEIGSVLSFEKGVIMFVVIVVTIMSVPGRIGIISIPGVIRFVDYGCRYPDTDMGLHTNL